MKEYLGTISVPAIAAAVYFVVKLIRYAASGNVKFERFIPLISAGLGVVFGVICYYVVPSCIPAENVVVAIVIGAASGFTAIGADQMMKRFGKKTETTSIEPTSEKDREEQKTKTEEISEKRKRAKAIKNRKPRESSLSTIRGA